jgi:hypothetical protein
MIYFFLEGLHTTTYSILRALNFPQDKRQAISFSKTHSILVPNICPLFFLSFFLLPRWNGIALNINMPN